MNNTTSIQGQNAFLIHFGENAPQGAVMNLFNQVSHKVQIPGVVNGYLVLSNANLSDWQKGVTDTSGATTAVIVPVDLDQMRGATDSLPSFLQTFISHQAVRAA